MALARNLVALAGGIVLMHAADPGRFAGSQTVAVGRALVYEMVTLHALKLAAVFMIVVSPLALRTRFLARRIAWLGDAIASALMFNGRCVEWMLLSFPLWVLLVSLFIPWDDLRAHRAGPARGSRRAFRFRRPPRSAPVAPP